MSQITSGVLSAPVTVPPGTILLLSAEQAAARSHRLVSLGERRSKDGLARYRADSAVAFKAGEALSIEGSVDKAVGQHLSGTAPERPAKEERPAKPAIDKARAEGHAAGRAEMLAEVTARNAVFDLADEALEKLTTAEAALAAAAQQGSAAETVELTQAVADAKAAHDAAEAAIAALPELKA